MSGKSYSHGILDDIGDDASNEKLIEIYGAWSKSYDMDAVRDFGYYVPATAVQLLSEKFKEFGFTSDARILDLGSGTGMVGEALHKLAYSNIDGVDISAESLEVAKGKGVYRNLICGAMASEECKDLGVGADQYDAAICMGVFTGGHVRGKGLDDLVHVVKSGGLTCFSIRDDVVDDPSYGYNEKMEALSKENKWKLVHKAHIPYHSKTGLRGWLYVFQVL